MADTRRNAALKDDNSLSLMYTLHALSRLSKVEFELLKKLRKTRESDFSVNDEDAGGILPGILEGFNLKSIQEVIAVVDHFRLFELYDF